MTTWTPISRNDHSLSHWRPRHGFEFFAKKQIVPIMLAELSKLLPHYAMGFVKNDDGVYEAIALIGLGGEKNLYTNVDGQWLCSYTPAHLRSYPFAFLNDTGRKRVLCIEESFLSDDEALPRLFREDGGLDSHIMEIVDFLKQCDLNLQQTKKAVSALASARLIEPWPLTIGRGEGEEPLKINGLHRVDEKALNLLNADSFSELRITGALSLAYAQLFSMAQLNQLTIRAEHLAKVNRTVSRTQELNNLFGNEDSGSLNFDAFASPNDNTENK